MKNNKRALLLMLAQIVCILLMALTVIPAVLPTLMLIDLMQHTDQLAQAAPAFDNHTLVLCLRDLALGACLVCAEMEALGILGQLKKTALCTEKNEAALGRISIALLIACGITLVLGDAIIPFLFTLLPVSLPLVERLLAPALLLCAALIVRAVRKKLSGN